MTSRFAMCLRVVIAAKTITWQTQKKATCMERVSVTCRSSADIVDLFLAEHFILLAVWQITLARSVQVAFLSLPGYGFAAMTTRKHIAKREVMPALLCRSFIV